MIYAKSRRKKNEDSRFRRILPESRRFILGTDMEALGICTVYDRTSLTDMEEIVSRIGDSEIVYTNKTPLTREVLGAMSES